jgi:hypothetical protein
MSRFLAGRLVHSVAVLVAVSILSFSLLYLTGDPAAALLPVEAVSKEELERFRKEMGFDDPLYVQYGRFASRAVRGDFGNSLRQNVPALDIVLGRLPNTLALAATTLLLTVVVSVPAGVAGAFVRRVFWNRLILGAVLLTQSIPAFWLGLILIIVFAVTLGWLPPGGSEQWDNLILPTVTLAAYPIAQLTRVLRAAVRPSLFEGGSGTVSNQTTEHLVACQRIIEERPIHGAVFPPRSAIRQESSFSQMPQMLCSRCRRPVYLFFSRLPTLFRRSVVELAAELAPRVPATVRRAVSRNRSCECHPLAHPMRACTAIKASSCRTARPHLAIPGGRSWDFSRARSSTP